MTPNELYAHRPETQHSDIELLWGFYYSHVPEVPEAHRPETDPTGRIVIKEHGNVCYDGRRIWRLASVWFDNKPVMAIQNAGREGDDHRERFITDKEAYNLMVRHIGTLIDYPTVETKIYDPNEDIEDLDSFYGCDLRSVINGTWRY